MKVDEDLNENAFGEKKEKKMQKNVLGFYLQVALVNFIYLTLNKNTLKELYNNYQMAA